MTHRDRLAVWVPAVTAGLVVLVAGLWERGHIDVFTPASTRTEVAFVCVFAVAVAAYRLLPSLALVLLWLLAYVQLSHGMPLMVVELAMALIAYGCARYGSVLTVVVSAARVICAWPATGWATPACMSVSALL